eukprot:3049267-Prymnesium_polylepis.1
MGSAPAPEKFWVRLRHVRVCASLGACAGERAGEAGGGVEGARGRGRDCGARHAASTATPRAGERSNARWSDLSPALGDARVRPLALVWGSR